ncbi:cytochrome C oxidase subunit IV family protein [Pseudonocardia sp. ICBG601]|uniref:cytochrome C oxidase subunit IV family protein n=1 Tax=Pseudonocardia sp. ICBG601 TaxID=2846759 RepID=UPI001CF6B943|nr:cytochrome C oxidase subunit IV family protein [Pseudonocardia sp. ICBG601]
MTGHITTRPYTRTLVVWVGLMAVTILSWYWADTHDLSSLVNSGIILLAFIKVYLVGHYFMELRNAPPLLRVTFTAWCVVICAALITEVFGGDTMAIREEAR